MSLSRLALRLAAIEALCPAALLTVPGNRFPTLAGPRVYDSRIDAIESLSDQDRGQPIVIVYTESTKSSPYQGGVHRPNEHFVDLVIEAPIAIGGTMTVQDADGIDVDVGTIETPVTDRQHEAMLDIHEGLIRRVFDRSAAVESAKLFFRVVMEVREIDSEPLRDADKTTRLAQRTLRFVCKVKGDEWPPPSLSPSALVGLDRLPSPLSIVAAALPAGSAALELCTAAAALIPDAGGLVQLAGIDIYSGVGRDPIVNDPDVHSVIETAAP